MQDRSQAAVVNETTPKKTRIGGIVILLETPKAIRIGTFVATQIIRKSRRKYKILATWLTCRRWAEKNIMRLNAEKCQDLSSQCPSWN